MMNLMPFFVIWAVLAIIVIVLAIYRKTLASHEDDTLHIHDSESAMVSQQAVMARKLEAVDRWGKILTVIVLLSGIALAVGYVYISWIANTEIRMG